MVKIDTGKSIHDFFFNEFGKLLPITGGTGLSKYDPIVMLKDVDYVENEFAVLEILMWSRPSVWHRVGQCLFPVGDKFIDCIEISVSDSLDQSEYWNESYYFDVTDCLHLEAG